MKKIFTLTATMIAVLFLSGMAHAAKFRVNNSGVDADFLQPQPAHDVASAGDTLYIESSAIPYNALNSTKRLVLIGTGYFLSENDSTQANVADCVIQWITFHIGSANSIITGVTVSGGLTLDDDNILVKRIRAMDITVISGNSIVITQSILNWIIFSENAVNFHLLNSIITGEGQPNCLGMGNTNSCIIKNNIFRKDHVIYNTVYENNIYEVEGLFGAANSTIRKNICSGVQYDTTGGNLQNVDMTTVFTYTGSPDGKYKFKEGSPAIGYGIGGVDCGIYGGTDPYVLSGMPTVPAIWLMNVNGTNVTVKAKSH